MKEFKPNQLIFDTEFPHRTLWIIKITKKCYYGLNEEGKRVRLSKDEICCHFDLHFESEWFEKEAANIKKAIQFDEEMADIINEI